MTLLSAMMLCKKAYKFVARNLRISASNSNLNVIAQVQLNWNAKVVDM